MSSHGHVHVPHVHVPHVHVPWGAPHHPSGEKSFLDDLDLASPLHTGYMFKEAHTHLVFHKRFFVLFPKVLVYYEKEADYNRDVAKGTLEHRHRAIGLSGLYLTKPEKKPKGAKYSFILHTPDKHNERCNFLLVTETREERKHWIEALQDRNPHLLDADHHAKHISPDTPQPPRKLNSSHSTEDSHSEHSSINSMTLQGGGQSLRPGSPRHDLHCSDSSSNTTTCSSTASMDLLDIQHLNIREGPSDTEDS